MIAEDNVDDIVAVAEAFGLTAADLRPTIIETVIKRAREEGDTPDEIAVAHDVAVAINDEGLRVQIEYLMDELESGMTRDQVDELIHGLVRSKR